IRQGPAHVAEAHGVLAHLVLLSLSGDGSEQSHRIGRTSLERRDPSIEKRGGCSLRRHLLRRTPPPQPEAAPCDGEIHDGRGLRAARQDHRERGIARPRGGWHGREPLADYRVHEPKAPHEIHPGWARSSEGGLLPTLKAGRGSSKCATGELGLPEFPKKHT